MRVSCSTQHIFIAEKSADFENSIRKMRLVYPASLITAGEYVSLANRSPLIKKEV